MRRGSHDKFGPVVYVRVAVHVLLVQVGMVPLCGYRPEGAVETATGSVCWASSDSCLLMVSEKCKIKINDLISKPFPSALGVEGIKVKEAQADPKKNVL